MLKYIFLGIVQGLTEFLPVSSSGHLVILQNILGIKEGGLALSLILHLGTAFALIIFFFKDILRLLRNIKLLSLILIVSIITGLIGILGKDFFESLFSAPRRVAIALIITGVILIVTKKFMDAKRNNLTIKDALVLGFTQAIAIIPGISRSGITISTLLFRKIDRETAFKFSFLVSIPVIFGAALLEAKKIKFVLNAGIINFAVGFMFSLVSGLIALWLIKIIISRAKLYYFGFYCIFVAVITLLFIK